MYIGFAFKLVYVDRWDLLEVDSTTDPNLMLVNVYDIDRCSCHIYLVVPPTLLAMPFSIYYDIRLGRVSYGHDQPLSMSEGGRVG